MARTGRPREYNPEMLFLLEQYTEEHDFPIVAEAAGVIGVHKSTIFDWSDPKSPRFNQEFSDSLTTLLDKQEAYLVNNGMNRHQGQMMPVFLLKANFDYVETSRQELTAKDGNPLFQPGASINFNDIPSSGDDKATPSVANPE